MSETMQTYWPRLIGRFFKEAGRRLLGRTFVGKESYFRLLKAAAVDVIYISGYSNGMSPVLGP